MTQIQIADDVAANFAQAAQERGCSLGELASAVISGWMHTQALELTAEQDAAVRTRLSKLNASEMIPGEELDLKFETLFRKLQSR